MTSPAASCPDVVRKRKSYESFCHVFESFPNDKSLSDFLLYKGNRDPVDANSHWTGATEEKVLGEQDINAWLEQQGDKSSTTTALDAFDGLEPRFASAYTPLTRPRSPGTRSPASPKKRNRGSEPWQQGDVPHTLREVGAFASSSEASPEKKKQKR
ncbi:hypothetical protein CPAR01_05200 [Colletotrichum paranaense]|uniref:Uncharacterized protein n=1 Tax=Colletotrichum paranaense TaxID=1914294 RepID=A0ABQ9SQL1_9PEZI|nr:uncharacterized protein CPAR01_05200 [Colletotrichum paranaense]KAK1541813.1 hypothetical protein CPAR01_05200 [Colletotrichum paranaense]